MSDSGLAREAWLSSEGDVEGYDLASERSGWDAGVAWAKADIEKHLDHAYKLGISLGLESAGVSVLRSATQEFQCGDDPLASRLRSIAGGLAKRGEEAHPGRDA